MKTWRMRIACWIPKAINTHSECVIIIAFPLQQWFHERASMLRYTCIACLVGPVILHSSCCILLTFKCATKFSTKLQNSFINI